MTSDFHDNFKHVHWSVLKKLARKCGASYPTVRGWRSGLYAPHMFLQPFVLKALKEVIDEEEVRTVHDINEISAGTMLKIAAIRGSGDIDFYACNPIGTHVYSQWQLIVCIAVRIEQTNSIEDKLGSVSDAMFVLHTDHGRILVKNLDDIEIVSNIESFDTEK